MEQGRDEFSDVREVHDIRALNGRSWFGWGNEPVGDAASKARAVRAFVAKHGRRPAAAHYQASICTWRVGPLEEEARE